MNTRSWVSIVGAASFLSGAISVHLIEGYPKKSSPKTIEPEHIGEGQGIWRFRLMAALQERADLVKNASRAAQEKKDTNQQRYCDGVFCMLTAAMEQVEMRAGEVFSDGNKPSDIIAEVDQFLKTPDVLVNKTPLYLGGRKVVFDHMDPDGASYVGRYSRSEDINSEKPAKKTGRGFY